MSTNAPSIFESFNARALNPEQVARTFVPSRQFEQLCKRCHTIVVGPRGSGKTTLLKMLQQPAIENWKHADADRIAGSIEFTGIFIGTDISWGQQLESLGYGVLDQDTHRRLSIASFTTHVLRALILGIQNRVTLSTAQSARSFRRVSLSENTEIEVVKSICSAWDITDTIPSLLALRQALTRRLLQIRTIANQEATLGEDGRPERIGGITFLHLHFLQAAGYAIEIFDDAVDGKGSKWALLFDELELAPNWVQDELLRSLRSTDDRFLFKLALNPFTSNTYLLRTPTSPAPGQDFDQIPLWYAEKRDSYAFCNSLWHEMLSQHELPSVPAKKMLGASNFDTPYEEWRAFGTAYRPGSRWSRRFASLAAKDKSFRIYLDSHNIDLNELHNLSESERAADVRKIAPVVAVRDFYRASDAAEKAVGRSRSRKSAILYSGAESLFAITEGNPRWFIGMMKHLLEDSAGEPTISPLRQADEMLNAAQRFSATLRTIPIDVTANTPMVGVLQLVRRIGRFFHTQTVKEDFRPEPPGSFTVDAHTPDYLLAILGQALNAGAIVYVPDDEGQLILTSLRGKRFRLSYLLGPLYGFPIRLGKDVALSTILRWNEESRSIDVDQLTLPESIEREE